MKSIELWVSTPAQSAELLLNPPKKMPRSIAVNFPMADERVRLLLERCASPRLQSLWLHGVALHDGRAWRKTLARFGGLKEIELRDSFVDGAGALEWLAQVRLRGLERMNVSGVDLSNVVSEISTRVLAPLAPTLEEAVFHDVSLNGHLASRLLRGLRLTLVGLGSNPLGDDGLRHMVSSIDLSRLSEVAMPSCELRDEGMKIVAFWLAGRRLTHVYLPRNGITARGASEIGHRWSANLRGSLMVGENQIGAEGIAALAPALRTVRALDLNEAALDRDAIERLSAMELPRLRALDIYDNELGDSAAAPLSRAHWLKQLSQINLYGNDLSARSIRPLVDAASRECTIWVRRGNRIAERTLKSLRQRNEGLL